MYSSGFGLSLIGMSMITTLIILTISSNVILSLGMVGALSIVRFRTAIKDPMDIVYLFWAISAGIVMGAGMIPLGVFGSLFIGVILYVFSNRKSKDQPYILIADCEDEDTENAVTDAVKSAVKKYTVKSKTVSAKGIELTVEVLECEPVSVKELFRSCKTESTEQKLLKLIVGDSVLLT